MSLTHLFQSAWRGSGQSELDHQAFTSGDRGVEALIAKLQHTHARSYPDASISPRPLPSKTFPGGNFAG